MRREPNNQEVKINQDILGQAINKLAILYDSQGKHDKAESLYLQALRLAKKLLGEDHLNTNILFNNFEDFLQQAIQENRVSELSNHPITQSLLEKLQSSL